MRSNARVVARPASNSSSSYSSAAILLRFHFPTWSSDVIARLLIKPFPPIASDLTNKNRSRRHGQSAELIKFEKLIKKDK